MEERQKGGREKWRKGARREKGRKEGEKGGSKGRRWKPLRVIASVTARAEVGLRQHGTTTEP